MGNVLHKATKRYLRSVNTPDYMTTDYIVNPDISAVEGQPPKYWQINPDDSVTLMGAIARASVDAAEAAEQKDNLANVELSDQNSILRAAIEVLMEQINVLRVNASLPAIKRAQLASAIRTKLDG